MTKFTRTGRQISTAVVVSLFIHLAVFGVATTMQSKVSSSHIREYIPVELVSLPSVPRAAVPLPVATAPQQVKAIAPVVQRDHVLPSLSPVAREVAAPPQPQFDAPAAGLTPLTRTTVASGEGITNREQPGTAVNNAPLSRQGTGTPQVGKRDKGEYLAFHRLSRLPAFRRRSEPTYPNTERMSGGEARVLAEIYLDESGGVDDVAIKKSGGKLFDKAVIDAIRQSSFHPGYIGEKAVATVIQIPYTFKLK